MNSNDRINTGGNRIGQVRSGPERSPEWRRGEPVSARKLNDMSATINRTYFGPGPGAQHTPNGTGGDITGNAVDVILVGQIRFFSE